MDGVANFLETIAPFRHNWKYINFTAVCAFVKEHWVILGANVFLDASPPEIDGGECPKFPEKTFRILKCNYQIEELESVLEEIRLGAINIAGEVVIFKRFNGESFSEHLNSLTFYGFAKEMFSDIGFKYDHFPRCGLLGSNESIWNIISRMNVSPYSDVNELLHSLDKPYSSLAALMKVVLNITRIDFTEGTSAHVRVMAPVKVRFSNRTDLNNAELCIALGIHPLWDYRDVNISVNIVYKDNSRETKAFNISEFSQNGAKNGFREFALIIPMVNVWRAELFLRQQDRFLEKTICEDYSVLDGNPRLAVLKYFDFNGIIFSDNIGGKRLGGRENDKTVGPRFESAVVMLLHVCGFNVVHYGQTKGLRDGEIDILAYVPGSNKILAVECTTENIDNKDKLGKLDLRVEKLRELLPNHNIYPVLATALSRQMAKKDMKIAADRKIAVLTQEKLQELVRKVYRQESSMSIASFILGGPYMQSLQDMIAGGLFGIDE